MTIRRATRSRALAALVAVLGFAGCTTDSDSSGAGPDSTPTSSAEVIKVEAGRELIQLATGRTYLFDKGSRAADRVPLIVGLHGFGATARRFAGFSGLSELQERGAIVAYGNARPDYGRAWNSGALKWIPDSVDDIGYLVDVVAEVRRRVPEVDPGRVYVVGFSMGAMMALRAMCDRPDVFAAAVGVAGGLTAPCDSDRPVRYLHIHGRADDEVPYDGGYHRSLDAKFTPVPDLRAAIRSTAPGSRVVVRSHPCGHIWPTADRCGIDATATLWTFLEG